MQNSTEIKKLAEEIKEDYRVDMGNIFPDEDNKCTLYDSFLSDTKKFITDDRPVSMVFDTLENISHWHLSVSQYKALTSHNKEALTEYISSLSYGYLYIKSNIEAWGCLNRNGTVYMDNAIVYMSQVIIADWRTESSYMATNIIKSINRIKNDNRAYDKTMLIDINKSSASWFIVEIYCKYKNIKLNHSDTLYPNNMQVYKKALDIWNIKDIVKIEQIIYLLAEYHLEQVENLKGTDRYYHEFGDQFRWLFPYEILVWLKLREKAGLKNPKTFTHPLMNTPIAKMFLSLKEPLPYPTELPYAKELLEKLQEQCPNVEIPQWLNNTKETDTTTDQKQDEPIIPDDFFKKE